MSPRFLISLIASVAFAGPLMAQEAPKGVVELFTSQGCSSCPPADAAFRKLIERGDVIALAYHVDYWNYLGWADTLSSKETPSGSTGMPAPWAAPTSIHHRWWSTAATT
jgi:hypothetical protein